MNANSSVPCRLRFVVDYAAPSNAVVLLASSQHSGGLQVQPRPILEGNGENVRGQAGGEGG